MASEFTPFDLVEESRRMWEERGWHDSVLGMVTVSSVMRAQQVLHRRAENVLRPMGLSFARYEVLALLMICDGGALALSKISEFLDAHPASITNVINRLEKADLLEKRPHETDGRTTVAVLTATGRRAILKASKALNEGVFSSIELSEGAMHTLIGILQPVR